MAVQPTTRSSFTSTIWNSAAKATHSINPVKFGGPNVNIREGSKVQFGDGRAVWDVVRVFEDGTLFLTTVSAGTKRTRRVPPSSASWTNLWIVDGRKLRVPGSEIQAPSTPMGGGPNRTIDPGNVVTLGMSPVRWVVKSVARDGTLMLETFNGDKIVTTTVGPQSKLWNSIYALNA